MVILARGTAAPVASVTLPEMLPKTACPKQAAGRHSNTRLYTKAFTNPPLDAKGNWRNSMLPANRFQVGRASALRLGSGAYLVRPREISRDLLGDFTGGGPFRASLKRGRESHAAERGDVMSH